MPTTIWTDSSGILLPHPYPQILVVRTYDCIKRLREALAATRSTVPSMLALSMVQVGTGEGSARDAWG